MGQSDNATNTLFTIGTIYKDQGNPTKAIDYLERSLTAKQTNHQLQIFN